MPSCEKTCERDSQQSSAAPESTAGATTASLFSIPGMDCPSEERLVRMALANTPGVAALEFDLGKREMRAFHRGPVEEIAAALAKLGMGATLVASAAVEGASPDAADTAEGSVLKWLLAINAVMFVVELATGWLAQSTGLIADSLDMFADAAVYGISLYAVGRDARRKLKAAHLSGWLQLLLGLGAFAEVVRRLVGGSEPEAPLMMSIALLAFAANVACLALLSRHRRGGVHMRASWIFSTNDVLANLGVILAGALVAWTGSNYPDLVIGTIISLLVLNGARRILQLKG